MRSDLADIARQIIDANRYLVLATADGAGQPWASPVWYAHRDYSRFFWVSRPGARHSRNIAGRPVVGAVIFDSTTAEAQAVYLEARAQEVTEADRAESIAVFSRRSRDFGLGDWTAAQVTEPATHRLYSAQVSAVFVLDAHDQRLPVTFQTSTG